MPPSPDSRQKKTVGRFAPSPTGPLHFGSLVAALASFLFARRSGGRWLVRIEDLDTPRTVAGSADAILESLRCFGLDWDDEPGYQSRRAEAYARAIESLREAGAVFDCACSRADLNRAASAPASSDPFDPDSSIYPGTCRSGLRDGRPPRAIRFHAPDQVISFHDLIHGRVEENIAKQTGDFVVRRADGLFAYQLAVVVDDATQGITQVVRGADLLSSTPRQIALQRALGLPEPEWAHVPLVLGPDGAKLGKRDGALPLPSLDTRRVIETLVRALRLLGIETPQGDTPEKLLDHALGWFDPSRIGREPYLLTTEANGRKPPRPIRS